MPRSPSRRSVLVGLTASVLAAGCGDPPVVVGPKEAKVACGMCRMGMPSDRGCFWAIELDGQAYTVTGKTPAKHENHAPDGMCNVDRVALVEGSIVGKQFRAKRFELRPLAAADLPEAPVFTPADVEGH